MFIVTPNTMDNRNSTSQDVNAAKKKCGRCLPQSIDAAVANMQKAYLEQQALSASASSFC